MRIADLNTLDRSAFYGAVGHVYEDTPWVAERAWSSRAPVLLPTTADLHDYTIVVGACG